MVTKILVLAGLMGHPNTVACYPARVKNLKLGFRRIRSRSMTVTIPDVSCRFAFKLTHAVVGRDGVCAAGWGVRSICQCQRKAALAR